MPTYRECLEKCGSIEKAVNIFEDKIPGGSPEVILDKEILPLDSDPTKEDTDGDFVIDSVDPTPLYYQLNGDLVSQLKKLENLSIMYMASYEYDKSYYNIDYNYWLIFNFIRGCTDKYNASNWIKTAGELNQDFINYVKSVDNELYQYFKNKKYYYADSNGNKGDLYHLAATITGLIYESNFSTGFESGIMPEYHIDNLCGWAGDLQTAMNDAYYFLDGLDDYDEFKNVMSSLIGYDKNKSSYVFEEHHHHFDMDDVYADVDAYNLYNLLKKAFLRMVHFMHILKKSILHGFISLLILKNLLLIKI